MAAEIIFNGITISDGDLFICSNDSGWWATPSRDVERIIIPGRNGELLRDNKRFNNLEIVLGFSMIRSGTAAELHDLLAEIAAGVGYKRLTNSEDPDHFRLAAFVAETAPTFGQLKRTGSVELTFLCKPQKYLTDGETMIAARSEASPAQLRNLTDYPAKPLIQIAAGETVRILGMTTAAGWEITYSGSTGPAILDFETLYFYTEASGSAESVADSVTVSKLGTTAQQAELPEFPVLAGGTWYYFASLASTPAAKIAPRWWEV